MIQVVIEANFMSRCCGFSICIIKMIPFLVAGPDDCVGLSLPLNFTPSCRHWASRKVYVGKEWHTLSDSVPQNMNKVKLHIIIQHLLLFHSYSAVQSLSLANGCVGKPEKRGTEHRVDSVVGLYVGVVEQEEKRKEDEVFSDVFTTATGVF